MREEFSLNLSTIPTQLAAFSKNFALKVPRCWNFSLEYFAESQSRMFSLSKEASSTFQQRDEDIREQCCLETFIQHNPPK